jgi:ribosome maturation factor RimP
MESRDTIQRLWEIVEPAVISHGAELVELEFQREPRGWVLRLYIDREGGVTLQDCTAVSREVNDLLDVKDPIHHPYHLEVSSPGIDRPIRKHKDFERFCGHRVKVTLSPPGDRRRAIQGVLQEVSEDTIRLHTDGGPMDVLLREICRARLIPPRDDGNRKGARRGCKSI